ESWWRKHQPFLDKSGYRLLPKFDPSWRPPWKINYELHKSEERALHSSPHVMDVIRVQDGRKVMLKQVSKSEYPLEVDLSVFLSSPPLSEDPPNHCVPIYGVLQSPHDPDYHILVMPRLQRFYSPSFDTVGELIEARILGVEFLHQHFIAHRYITILNLMLDGSKLYPKGCHSAKHWMNEFYTGGSKHITRTECWPRYFIIDFWMSRRYVPPEIRYEPVSKCGNRYVPEYIGSKAGDQCNPSPTDVFCLGNMLKEYFYRTHRPLQFLVPLVDDMVHKEPSLRPTISEIVQRFAVLCDSLTKCHLRKPSNPGANPIFQPTRQLRHIITLLPPLPILKFPVFPTTGDHHLRPFYTLIPGAAQLVKKQEKLEATD
ncbi:hypothetical protein F5146DRAFT_934001, partial [Armillaria mellea]